MFRNRFAILNAEAAYDPELHGVADDAASDSSRSMAAEDSPATSNFTDEAAQHLAAHGWCSWTRPVGRHADGRDLLLSLFISDDAKRGIYSVHGSHAENAYRTYRINWTWTMRDSRVGHVGFAFPTTLELAAADMPAAERIFATHPFGEFNQNVRDPRVRTSVPAPPSPIEDVPPRIDTSDRGTNNPLRKHASIWKWSAYSSKDFERGKSKSARRRRARRAKHAIDLEAQTRSDFKLKFKEKFAHRLWWLDTACFTLFRYSPMISTFT